MISHSFKLQHEFNFNTFSKTLELNLNVEYSFDNETYFTIANQSTTLFLLSIDNDEISLSMDTMASYADYKAYPYLLDVLSSMVTDTHHSKIDNITSLSIYKRYNEEWVETSIAEAVANIKSVLSIAPRAYFSLAFEDYTYISKTLLATCGVGLTSSTPRIYGYIQLLLKRNLLPQATNKEIVADMQANLEGQEVEVPQHISIGRIKSWQLDGSETWDSYSKEDIDMLLDIENSNLSSTIAETLNDIGAIYQEGVGVEQDGKKAEYWFKQAIAKGDLVYAPTNLGDLYRKGCGEIEISLRLAVEAYSISKDPYAWFRMGESYEQGWVLQRNMPMAMLWYEKAAAAGHHRALKRLKRTC